MRPIVYLSPLRGRHSKPLRLDSHHYCPSTVAFAAFFAALAALRAALSSAVSSLSAPSSVLTFFFFCEGRHQLSSGSDLLHKYFTFLSPSPFTSTAVSAGATSLTRLRFFSLSSALSSTSMGVMLAPPGG